MASNYTQEDVLNVVVGTALASLMAAARDGLPNIEYCKGVLDHVFATAQAVGGFHIAKQMLEQGLVESGNRKLMEGVCGALELLMNGRG